MIIYLLFVLLSCLIMLKVAEDNGARFFWNRDDIENCSFNYNFPDITLKGNEEKKVYN